MITLPEAEIDLIMCAQECERFLRLAAFADTETSPGESLAEELRRAASLHSVAAFALSRTVVRLRASP